MFQCILRQRLPFTTGHQGGFFFWAMFLASLGCVAGCGPKRDTTVKVTGTVMYRGQPVAKAQIMFLGEGHASASGTSDEQGHFTLLTYKPGDGAVPGKYKVSVVKREPVVDPKNANDPYAPMRDLLPAQYVNPSTSPMEVEVTARGPNDFPLNLAD